jgi:hypothetical protein
MSAFRASKAINPTMNRLVPPPDWHANAMGQDGGFMPEHKFKIGQSVQFTSGPFGRGAATGIYKVTQLLPPEGDEYQYRIKSAREPHERVVKESQMARVA